MNRRLTYSSPEECMRPPICWNEFACFWYASADPSVCWSGPRQLLSARARPDRQRAPRKTACRFVLFAHLCPLSNSLPCPSCNIEAGMGAFIEAIDLHKTYRVGKIDVAALRGISFSVQKGEFVTVVGPSGSGKSTLFYLLGGLTHADSGKVIMDGDDFATLSDAERTRMRKRKIGFVFQKFNLLPTLDARSNIFIAQEISGNGNVGPAYFSSITDWLGLTKRLGPRPSELSGGEQQRVALARALINKPAVVLADEPTGNLDSKNSHVVLGMLRLSNEELGQTVLMITHNSEAA